MAKNNGFTVPAGERKDFKLLVQRANRTINANLRFIEKEDVQTGRAQRQLLGDYIDKNAWHTEKTAFSRGVRFDSEKAYKDYVRQLQRWGGEGAEKSVKSTRQRVYENIVKSLNTTADIYGQGVKDDSGHLPKEITERLEKMSVEQLLNFFDIADPTEDIEHQSWSYEEYQEGVDRDTFVDITMTRLNYLEQVVKDKRVAKSKHRIKNNKTKSKVKKKNRKKTIKTSKKNK